MASTASWVKRMSKVKTLEEFKQAVRDEFAQLEKLDPKRVADYFADGGEGDDVCHYCFKQAQKVPDGYTPEGWMVAQLDDAINDTEMNI